MASLDVGMVHVLWHGEQVMCGWTREILIEFAKKLQELKIKPEIELFNPTNLEDVEDYLMPY